MELVTISPTNIIIAAIKYFFDKRNADFILIASRTKYISTHTPINSAKTDDIVAPIAAYFGINIKLPKKLTIAEATTAYVYWFCRFVDTKYCCPITLANPIKIAIGEHTFINNATFSNPLPKNQGTKLSAVAINPKVIGIDKNHTKLKLLYI